VYINNINYSGVVIASCSGSFLHFSTAGSESSTHDPEFLTIVDDASDDAQ